MNQQQYHADLYKQYLETKSIFKVQVDPERPIGLQELGQIFEQLKTQFVEHCQANNKAVEKEALITVFLTQENKELMFKFLEQYGTVQAELSDRSDRQEVA